MRDSLPATSLPIPTSHSKRVAGSPNRFRFAFMVLLCTGLGIAATARAQSAFVRVNQVGYEANGSTMRAYLMTTANTSGATFKVINSEGVAAHSGLSNARERCAAHCEYNPHHRAAFRKRKVC